MEKSNFFFYSRFYFLGSRQCLGEPPAQGRIAPYVRNGWGGSASQSSSPSRIYPGNFWINRICGTKDFFIFILFFRDYAATGCWTIVHIGRKRHWQHLRYHCKYVNNYFSFWVSSTWSSLNCKQAVASSKQGVGERDQRLWGIARQEAQPNMNG